MTPLGQYYIRQAGGGGRGDRGGIGPVYALPPFVQREYGIGSYLAGLFRTVRPILWSGAKTLGREALRTGGKIMSDIASNPQVPSQDIISKHVRASTQNLVQQLRGGGRRKKADTRKRKRAPSVKRTAKTKKKVKRTKTTKKDIFS